MSSCHLNILLFIFAALPGTVKSCSEPDQQEIWCPSADIAAHPENYPELCGSTSSDVHCVTTVPENLADLNKYEQFTEVSMYLVPPVEIPHENYLTWKLEKVFNSTIRFWTVPFHYGLPVTVPLSEIRSDSYRLRAYESRMSAYMCTSDTRGGCIIDMLSAWSWTLRHPSDDLFANDYMYATRVMAMRGNCQLGPEKIKVGDVWKGSGKLYRRGGLTQDSPPCEEDGWCNPGCYGDPDCNCYHNGVCDSDCPDDPDCETCYENETCDDDCPGDPGCECLDDDFCNPECEDWGLDDPDCDCSEDGWCNPICMDSDPDCECRPEGTCNPDCMNHDPDCQCIEDGYCNPACGWFDPDCQCLEDGLCGMCECEEDPDCPEDNPLR